VLYWAVGFVGTTAGSNGFVSYGRIAVAVQLI